MATCNQRVWRSGRPVTAALRNEGGIAGPRRYFRLFAAFFPGIPSPDSKSPRCGRNNRNAVGQDVDGSIALRRVSRKYQITFERVH